LAVIAKEFEMELAETESNPFWSSSQATKHFGNSVANLGDAPRARKPPTNGTHFYFTFKEYCPSPGFFNSSFFSTHSYIFINTCITLYYSFKINNFSFGT
jgi:hypothetical protein